MAAKLPISEDSSKKLKALLNTVRTKDGYRRAMVIAPRQKKSVGASASPPTDSSLTYRDAQGRLRVRRSGAWQPLREEDGVGGEGRESNAEASPAE